MTLRPRQRKAVPTHAAKSAEALENRDGSVGGADPDALKRAAQNDGAGFVRSSSRARAHVRRAPPSVRAATMELDAGTCVVGAPTTLQVTGQKALLGAYVIVEVDALVTSHDAKTFAVRVEYPTTNERRYDVDPYEQIKVANNAARLVPAFLITDNPDSVNGPPVVVETDDGVLAVLGGNSRAMSLSLAYERGQAQAYRALLVERSKVFGVDPGSLDAFKRPALIRLVEAEAPSWQGLSRSLNEAQTQEKDTNADAVSLSHRISADAQAELARSVEGDETLAAFLTSPRARTFVRLLWRDGVITQQSAGRLLVDADLSAEGRNVVARALVARLVPDAATLEGMGPARRDLIARAAPALLEARAAGHDVGPALLVALQDTTDAEARARTSSTQADAAAGDLFGDLTKTRDRGPEAVALRELLQGGQARALRALRRFGAMAKAEPVGQGSLYGAPRTTRGLLDAAIAAETDKP